MKNETKNKNPLIHTCMLHSNIFLKKYFSLLKNINALDFTRKQQKILETKTRLPLQ
jgi:hypothetical protein